MAKKIMIVDNEKNIVDLLSKFLIKQGFEVLPATEGLKAIELAKTARPDLILLDVMMPGMDGGAVAAELSEDERTRRIPIVFLTAAISEEEAIKRSGQPNSHSFVSKAGMIGDLIKTINKILGLS